MLTEPEWIAIQEALAFSQKNASILTPYCTNLVLSQQGDAITECRLTLQATPSLYHQITTHNLFNLKPEICGPLTNGDFLPDTDVSLDLTLHPDFLPHLHQHANTPQEAATYLLTLSQQTFASALPNPPPSPTPESATPTSPQDKTSSTDGSPDYASPDSPEADSPAPDVPPLLNTENWLCLSVKQQQGNTETGFSTFWAYVNPSVLQQAATSSEQISTGIAEFFTEWVEANLSEAVQDITDELIEDITQVFEGLAHDLNDLSAPDESATDGELFETVVTFFELNDWPVAQIEEETALQLAFQGNNGQWACYASTNEARQEFVFYSRCPVSVPEHRRLDMAEFLTRANYGITIGNFEMDFDNGEIHYKTSIDVEGDQLSIALVQQLVFANVMTMDQYLPGILAVIYGNVLPSEAIAQIESPQ